MASAVADLMIEPVHTLAEEEAIIERGMASFIEVGKALARIREGRLYADEFDTFEDYCRERWDMSWSHARNTIAAARVAEVLRSQHLPIPPNATAVRPLVRVMNEAGSFDRSTNTLRNPRAAERAVVGVMKKVAKAKEKEAAADPEAKPKPITGRDVQKIISPPTSTRKPGWFELAGAAADHLIAADRELTRLEADLNIETARHTCWEQVIADESLSQKTFRYAEMARNLSNRLDVIAKNRQETA